MAQPGNLRNYEAEQILRNRRSYDNAIANDQIPEFVQDRRFWAEYRDPSYEPEDPLHLIQTWRVTPRPAYNFVNPGVIPRPPFPPDEEYEPKRLSSRRDDAIAFMQQNIRKFGEDQARWKGTKLLGRGGFGIVGLWEYAGPAGENPLSFSKVVIKEALPQDRFRGQNTEDNILNMLSQTDSDHIVHKIAESERVGHGEHENDDGLGRVKRLFLEFCEMHSLKDLLDYRSLSLKRPFNEYTLWRFFDCLIDGASVLETGKELVVVSKTAFSTAPRNKTGILLGPHGEDLPWETIVHFDLKPANIMLKEHDTRHEHTPLLKIGDFGLARMPPNPDQIQATEDEWREREYLRFRGTRHYYTPEQFTGDWDYRDYKESGIAGIYGTKSNVWGIGQIMYQLITCQNYEQVDISRPFVPIGNVIWLPEAGRTYGKDLENFCSPESNQYSQGLITVIWACLCERPAQRISLLALKKKVQAALRWCRQEAIKDGVSFHEDWNDFIVMEGPDMIQDAEEQRAEKERNELLDLPRQLQEARNTIQQQQLNFTSLVRIFVELYRRWSRGIGPEFGPIDPDNPPQPNQHQHQAAQAPPPPPPPPNNSSPQHSSLNLVPPRPHPVNRSNYSQQMPPNPPGHHQQRARGNSNNQLPRRYLNNHQLRPQAAGNVPAHPRNVARAGNDGIAPHGGRGRGGRIERGAPTRGRVSRRREREMNRGDRVSREYARDELRRRGVRGGGRGGGNRAARPPWNPHFRRD